MPFCLSDNSSVNFFQLSNTLPALIKRLQWLLSSFNMILIYMIMNTRSEQDGQVMYIEKRFKIFILNLSPLAWMTSCNVSNHRRIMNIDALLSWESWCKLNNFKCWQYLLKIHLCLNLLLIWTLLFIPWESIWNQTRHFSPITRPKRWLLVMQV